jgi:hypothetical protein
MARNCRDVRAQAVDAGLDEARMGEHRAKLRANVRAHWLAEILCRAKTRRMARELAFRRSGARPCRWRFGCRAACHRAAEYREPDPS